ncbi:MAG: LapA family protein, partial [Candidatus Dadabacteria bacterium]|nr:LapA family protein [Candidatus Dadabacteria bacterium]
LCFFSFKITWAFSVAGIMGAAFLLGAFVFFLLTFARGHSVKSELKRSRETVKDLEEKVGKLEVELLQNKPAGYQERPSSHDVFKTPK